MVLGSMRPSAVVLGGLLETLYVVLTEADRVCLSCTSGVIGKHSAVGQAKNFCRGACRNTYVCMIRLLSHEKK